MNVCVFVLLCFYCFALSRKLLLFLSSFVFLLLLLICPCAASFSRIVSSRSRALLMLWVLSCRCVPRHSCRVLRRSPAEEEEEEGRALVCANDDDGHRIRLRHSHPFGASEKRAGIKFPQSAEMSPIKGNILVRVKLSVQFLPLSFGTRYIALEICG